MNETIENEAVNPYLKILENSYIVCKETFECPPESMAEFLSNFIFCFTTYDSEIGALFGKKAVEVALAINNGLTFEYIEDEENYKWFLIMCNMPFFNEKLDWASSIRGAWWDIWGNKTFDLSSCWLVREGGSLIMDLELNADQWHLFVWAMAEFLAMEISADDGKVAG